MIYFVQSLMTQHVKIGTTKQLTRRLSGLRQEAGGEVDVLGVTNGGFPEETTLHQHFQHLHIMGEWFRPEPDLLDFIGQNARAWDGKDEKPLQSIMLRLDERILNALDAAVERTRPRSSRTGVIEFVLEEWLRSQNLLSNSSEEKPL